MRKGVLMYGEEPTDEEFAELLHEVAVEAKEKSDKATKLFNEDIENRIKIAMKEHYGK